MSLDTTLARSNEKSTTSIRVTQITPLLSQNLLFSVHHKHIIHPLISAQPRTVCKSGVTACSHSLHSGLAFSPPRHNWLCPSPQQASQAPPCPRPPNSHWHPPACFHGYRVCKSALPFLTLCQIC